MSTTKFNDNFVVFHYCSCRITPYKDNDGKSSSRLLKDILKKLAELPGNERLIDSLKGQAGPSRRELVHVSARFYGPNRCHARLAKVKDKAPFAWDSNTGAEEQLENPKNRRYIDMTNYLIDFTPEDEPVMMVEFNNEGPRILDIEFFLRKVATKYLLAKYIKFKLHTKFDIKGLSSKVSHVFDLKVKVNAAQLIHLNGLSKLDALKDLRDEAAFQDVRLEFSFGYQKEGTEYRRNTRALDFFRSILGFLDKKPDNLDHFKALKAKYMDEDHSEPIEMDFIKNKITSILNVPSQEETKYLDLKELRHKMDQEIFIYLETGEVNDEHLD
jgi:hypothetical protein